MTTLEAGSVAPAFTATTNKGETVTLEGLLKQVPGFGANNSVLFWFYPRASTGG